MYSSFKHLLKAKAMNENTILVKRLQDWSMMFTLKIIVHKSWIQILSATHDYLYLHIAVAVRVLIG